MIFVPLGISWTTRDNNYRKTSKILTKTKEKKKMVYKNIYFDAYALIDGRNEILGAHHLSFDVPKHLFGSRMFKFTSGGTAQPVVVDIAQRIGLKRALF